MYKCGHERFADKVAQVQIVQVHTSQPTTLLHSPARVRAPCGCAAQVQTYKVHTNQPATLILSPARV